MVVVMVCVCVCVCVCVYIYIYIRVRACVCVCMRRCMYELNFLNTTCLSRQQAGQDQCWKKVREDLFLNRADK